MTMPTRLVHCTDIDLMGATNATLRVELHEGLAAALVLTLGWRTGAEFRPDPFQRPMPLPIEVIPQLRDVLELLAEVEQ